jgi:predicted RNase H-like HicB family nuclease
MRFQAGELFVSLQKNDIVILYSQWRTIMKIQIILEPSDEGGYTAYIPSLPGCISEGNTREDTLINIREAIDLYLEPVDDDRSFAPNAEQVELAV